MIRRRERDMETAEMAIKAALTGHLVFSTLHTKTTRLPRSPPARHGVPSYLCRSTMLGVMAQRSAHCVLTQGAARDRRIRVGDAVSPWKATSQSTTYVKKAAECSMTVTWDAGPLRVMVRTGTCASASRRRPRREARRAFAKA